MATRNPSFLFGEYEPGQGFFTWAIDEEYSTETNMPVIYVATPENMKYTETESLKASGFNSYIKFSDPQTAASCTSTDILSLFNLTDNAPQFAGVRNYIDGLQKSLGTTIMWFGLVFVMLMLLLIGLLLVGAVSLVQAVIFIKYMAHNELKNFLIAFKGE